MSELIRDHLSQKAWITAADYPALYQRSVTDPVGFLG